MKRSNGGPVKHHVDRCICGKKKSSFNQANKEAKYLKYHKKYPSLVPSVYKCKESGWWHVGNKA